MKMNTRGSTNKILLILASLVTVLLVLMSVLKITNLKETVKLSEIEKTSLEQNQQRLMRLRALDKISLKMETALTVLKKQIPEEPEEHQLIYSIQQISSDSGVDFESIQFSERVGRDTMVEMPLNITVKGKYASVVKFLNHLAAGERLMRIDEIVINKAEDGTNRIEAKMKALAFSR